MMGRPLSSVGGGLTLTYLQNATDNANSTTYTFSGQDIGSADTTRRIVVAVALRGSGISDLPTCTVGGITATRHAVSSTASGQWLALFSVEVPTGTTADVYVAIAGTASRCGIAMYSVTGATSALTDTDSRATAGALSLDVSAGGVCVAATYGYDTLSYTWSWTGVTEHDEFFTELSTLRCSVAGTDSGSAQTLTPTPTPTRVLDDYNAVAATFHAA